MSAARRVEILIATNNPNKFREIVHVLSEPSAHAASAEVLWRSLSDLPTEIPEPREDRDTFEGNASLKARAYSTAARMWALADDSGLEVDALAGEPGVHSAYYDRAAARLPRHERDRANNAKLVKALAAVPLEKRAARYHCVMCLADGDRILAMTHGVFEGRIVDSPRGSNGFGYDPYFLLPAVGKTVAELSPEEKKRISHRAQALRAMRETLSKLLSSSPPGPLP